MARGIALSVIRTKLKAALRDTQETNTVADAELNYALADMQAHFANAYDWPFLEDKWDIAVAAGTRYYALPTSNIRAVSATPNLARPALFERLFGTIYERLQHGIGSEQLNYINSDSNETQDPIQRWSLDTNTGDASLADQVEFWPIPATAGTVRLTAQRTLRTFTADADKADLDDLLLVNFCAADYLAFRGQKNAALMASRAQSYLVNLRSGYPTTEVRIVLGRQNMFQRENVKLIAVT